jgi:hypothetical protein
MPIICWNMDSTEGEPGASPDGASFGDRDERRPDIEAEGGGEEEGLEHYLCRAQY